MLIAISTYLKPLHEVELTTPEHRAYLQKLIQEQKLLVSGRQNPPVGGVLIFKITSKSAVEEILKEDPFMKKGIADYKIIEFQAGLYDPNILPLLEPMR